MAIAWTLKGEEVAVQMFKYLCEWDLGVGGGETVTMWHRHRTTETTAC